MIQIKGDQFVDQDGRTLLLRGVNLGGSTKVPFTPNGATWNPEGFFDHRQVSFVGRPFPLEEADEHLSRLKAWGFTFLRFLITWEAIEHEGPGIYDQDYLAYLRAVIEKTAEYGIQVFIDPHQDVWSRFSGGDGAPGWTLEAVGLDMTKFKATGAAIVHATHGDPFPRMIWPTNYGKLANLTMWTLFFGGNDFAPQTMIEGVPAQEYLQSHYFNAIKQVAERLKDLPNVVGYDTLNEPSAGIIGTPEIGTVKLGSFKHGNQPTVFQTMLLGSGYPQEVEVWNLGMTGERKTGKTTLNREGTLAWLDGFLPIWRQNGVWDVDAAGSPQLLRPNHFSEINGRQVDFHNDYFRPFANRFAEEIRSVLPETLIFIEGVPNEGELHWTEEDAPNVIHAGHWYDSVVLLLKTYKRFLAVHNVSQKIILGARRARQSRRLQIAETIAVGSEQMGGIPTVIGEVGIPFDLNNKQAYRTGNFSTQVEALNATMEALEENFASFTLWNYTADNTNERGDQWNDEDLSLFSRDQQTGTGDIHDGGRALQAAVRPYASKVAGTPHQMRFDIKARKFVFVFTHDPTISAPTELFVPNYQYPDGYEVTVSDGEVEIDPEAQTLRYQPANPGGQHRIELKPKG